jgi:hypothetical protein
MYNWGLGNNFDLLILGLYEKVGLSCIVYIHLYKGTESHFI